MLLLPDASSAFIDPFRVEKTLALNFFIHDPFTREAYSRDPRNIARKAETYLASSGVADTAYFGAEAEFYIFDSIRHETAANKAFYYIDSIEGAWNTGTEEVGGNRGYKTAYKGGYFPVAPVDHYSDLRDAMVRKPGRRRLRRRALAPRGRHRRSGRDQLPLLARCSTPATRCSCSSTSSRTPPGRRQDRDVHAEAALRRQRLGHAHPPEPLAGRRAAVLRRDRLRRPLRHRPLVRRRSAAPRAVAAGVHEPDDQLVPSSGARLRGAGQPGLLAAQPLRLHPDPGHGHATRRPSASSSGCRTRRATRTSRSRR